MEHYCEPQLLQLAGLLPYLPVVTLVIYELAKDLEGMDPIESAQYC